MTADAQLLIPFRIVIEFSTTTSGSKKQAARTSTQSRSTGVQRRGAERVKALLAAAEELLAEQGYEGATLKAIGERAGIPTASVYHYFADRFQIEAELMARHTRALDGRIIGALDALPPCTLGEAVDAVVDAVVAYFRSRFEPRGTHRRVRRGPQRAHPAPPHRPRTRPSGHPTACRAPFLRGR